MRNWLKELRQAAELTMKQLAEKAGISECYYSQIENGHRSPAVNVAKKIASVLDVPWEKFFE